jgi:Family of unknown function (DUF6526)
MANSGQTYSNHTRFFPPFHFIAFPILTLNLLNELRHVWQTPTRSTAFTALVAFGLVLGLLSARLMALKVQDRVIRLELQLRMRNILPADLQTRMYELTPRQMVALRFASDKELADLVRDVLAGKLANQKAIKLAIKEWQGDYLRA